MDNPPRGYYTNYYDNTPSWTYDYDTVAYNIYTKLQEQNVFWDDSEGKGRDKVSFFIFGVRNLGIVVSKISITSFFVKWGDAHEFKVLPVLCWIDMIHII